MGRHRQARTRPRYGRIGLAACSLSITAVAVLGGVGVLPSPSDDYPPRSAAADIAGNTLGERESSPPPDDASADAARTTNGPDLRSAVAGVLEGAVASSAVLRDDVSLPADSGEGRRVVFSESRQRVWLVGDRGRVQRTYLVSGSVYDNLDPGTFEVYSRSEQAWGIDDSGTMRYFVRFTRGENAAIGFHDIPEQDGRRVQTFRQLGTPLSHGCIRQRRSDAIALWEFAPVGTTVVVTA
ncbi:L,D-transpeptidase [Nocardioides pacificus]